MTDSEFIHTINCMILEIEQLKTEIIELNERIMKYEQQRNLLCKTNETT